MNATTNQLIDAALALSAGERVELIEAVLTSLQPSDRPPFDDSWREVIRRRAIELQTGAVKAVPWSEVKRQARNLGSD